MQIRLKLLGENSADVATSYGNIGSVYFRSKDFKKVLAAHLKPMQIREVVFGPNAVELTQSFNNLGNTYKELKDYPNSAKYYQKAIENKLLQVGAGSMELKKYYLTLSELHYLMNNKVQGDNFKSLANFLK